MLSVEEAIQIISNGSESVGRFNKKDFNLLMLALANDTEFEIEVGKVKGGNLNLSKIMPTKEFRKWCKKFLISSGMDKKEASKVLSSDFLFESMDGLYEFFATAVYMYMEYGNKFDFIPREDFKGSIYLDKIKSSTTTKDEYSPKDRVYLGQIETTTGEYKKLKTKSTCPKWLKTRKKIK